MKAVMSNLTNQPPNNIGRWRRADVVKGRPGSVPMARNTHERADPFHMLLTK